MIKMQYLGSGAAEGFPGVFCECPACQKARTLGGRNVKMRSCTLLNDHILIDLSPDIFAQSLKWNVRLSDVDHIVVTHSHSDHLDPYALFTRAKPGATILPGRPKALDVVNIYGNREVGRVIADGMSMEAHSDPSRIRWHSVEIGERFWAGELAFLPLKANHKRDEVCYIYAVSDGVRQLLYGNDTGQLPQETLGMIRSLGLCFDVVSLDCARGTLPGDGHMGLKEDVELKRALEAMGAVKESTRFYLNHFSHMCGLIHDEFQKLADKESMTVVYDGLTVTV